MPRRNLMTHITYSEPLKHFPPILCRLVVGVDRRGAANCVIVAIAIATSYFQRNGHG